MTEPKTSSAGIVNLIAGSRRVHWLIIAAMVATYGLYEAFVAAQAARAIAQEQFQQTIADENRAFCEKFGMRAGASAFVACSQELAIIRQKQADRDSAAAQGFL